MAAALSKLKAHAYYYYRWEKLDQNIYTVHYNKACLAVTPHSQAKK